MSDGGRMTDPLLGEITAYREYKPVKDVVEITTFFRMNGVRYRNDIEIGREELESIELMDTPQREEYVRNKVIVSIYEGNFVLATDPMKQIDTQEVLNKLRETTRDSHWLDEPTAESNVSDMGDSLGRMEAGVEAKPSETELALVAIAMRNYDVLMAILTHFNEEDANRIYEAHEKGEHFNPPIYIPTLNEIPNDSESDSA